MKTSQVKDRLIQHLNRTGRDDAAWRELGISSTTEINNWTDEQLHTRLNARVWGTTLNWDKTEWDAWDKDWRGGSVSGKKDW